MFLAFIELFSSSSSSFSWWFAEQLGSMKTSFRQECTGILNEEEWSSLSVLCSDLTGSVQFSSVTQSCPTLCDPMNRSTPGLPVHCQLPEFTQTHVHRVGDAIQPSHSLSSPSPAPNPSQHQGVYTQSNQLFIIFMVYRALVYLSSR